MIAVLLPAIASAVIMPTILARIPILRAVDVVTVLLSAYAVRRVRWSRIMWSAIIAGIIVALIVGEPVFVRPIVYLAGLSAATRLFPHFRSDPRRVDALGIAGCMAIAATIVAVILLGWSVASAWPHVIAFGAANAVAGFVIAWIVFPRTR